MDNKLFAQIDLRDPRHLQNPAFRRAVFSVGDALWQTHFEEILHELHESCGYLTQIDEQRVAFFFDAVVAEFADDGIVRLHINGVVADSEALKRLPLTRDQLGRALRAAAIDYALACQLQYIRRITGVPELQGSDSVYTWGWFGEQLANDLARGQLNEVIAIARDAILNRMQPEALKLARSMSTRATFDDYNRMAANRTMSRQIRQEARHLMPLINAALAEKIIDQVNSDALAQVKTDVLRRGHSEGVWKTLTRFNTSQMRVLISRYGYTGMIEIAALIHESEEMPPKELFERWLNDRNHPYQSILPPAWFRRAAVRRAKACRDAGELQDFLRTDYPHALDWLRARTPRPDRNQLKAGWGWIARQTELWTQETRAMYRRPNRTWESMLPAYEDDGYEVVPLTSTQALTQEGQRMNHCVGSYDHRCLTGHCRIFSIRQDGKSLTTVEISHYGNHWQVHQAKASCNTTPADRIQAVARRLAQHYNRAWQRVMQADVNGQETPRAVHQ